MDFDVTPTQVSSHMRSLCDPKVGYVIPNYRSRCLTVDRKWTRVVHLFAASLALDRSETCRKDTYGVTIPSNWRYAHRVEALMPFYPGYRKAGPLGQEENQSGQHSPRRSKGRVLFVKNVCKNINIDQIFEVYIIFNTSLFAVQCQTTPIGTCV